MIYALVEVVKNINIVMVVTCRGFCAYPLKIKELFKIGVIKLIELEQMKQELQSYNSKLDEMGASL